ncbi:MAG: zinc metallopeptidase [Flavobacteriales bacterium]|nr:zinc metallopeptidase [Flavobacteriales bacterium]
MIGIYILGIVFFIISLWVSNKLKSKFKKYSEVRLQSDMSGEEIAKKMLSDNGIYDVKVVTVEGQLTDHYNPLNKTVNLSHAVFYERNAAAAAISAHECGHAVQHSKSYAWLNLRSKLVPVVNASSNYMQWIILAGIMILYATKNPTILIAGIVLFALTTLFSFITLPVEFDASKRALKWISDNNVVTESEYEMSKDALKWAALTYVVAALGSLATLLYYISMLNGNRNN